jgi:hypothetical protein
MADRSALSLEFTSLDSRENPWLDRPFGCDGQYSLRSSTGNASTTDPHWWSGSRLSFHHSGSLPGKDVMNRPGDEQD